MAIRIKVVRVARTRKNDTCELLFGFLEVVSCCADFFVLLVAAINRVVFFGKTHRLLLAVLSRL